MQYLHLQYGIPLDGDALASAGASGSISLASWVLARGCPVPEYVFSGAVAAGHVHMVRWLAQEAGCKPSLQDLGNLLHLWPFLPGGRQRSEDCAQAARVILAGLPGWREQLGEERRPFAVRNAAWRGDLELVRYMCEEEGCGVDAEVLLAAAHGGCEALLELLVFEAGCPVDAEAAVAAGLPDPYFIAAHHHDVGTIQCLRRLGVPWQTDLLSFAIQEGCSVAGLRALVAELGPVEREEVMRAWESARAVWGPPGMREEVEELVRGLAVAAGVGIEEWMATRRRRKKTSIREVMRPDAANTGQLLTGDAMHVCN